MSQHSVLLCQAVFKSCVSTESYIVKQCPKTVSALSFTLLDSVQRLCQHWVLHCQTMSQSCIGTESYSVGQCPKAVSALSLTLSDSVLKLYRHWVLPCQTVSQSCISIQSHSIGQSPKAVSTESYPVRQYPQTVPSLKVFVFCFLVERCHKAVTSFNRQFPSHVKSPTPTPTPVRNNLTRTNKYTQKAIVDKKSVVRQFWYTSL